MIMSALNTTADKIALFGVAKRMKQREPKIPKVAKRYLKDSLDRLIQHFEDWAKESEADEWRKKMLAGPS